MKRAYKSRPVIERFFKKVKKTAHCWEWTGAMAGGEYGQLKVKGRKFLAHRLSWTLHYGEIPKGLLICHKCDNPKCINPEHLFIGTNKDNINDMYRKGRGKVHFGEKHVGSKLKEKQIKEIRQKYITKSYSMKQLAKEYNCSASNICYIVNKKLWPHI